MTTDKLYTLKEISEILRVTRQTVYNNIKNGRIKATKFGNQYRVTEKDLKEILKYGYK